MDGRPTWTDCDEAGDYVVPNVLSPRDLVFRLDNVDETVPHTQRQIQTSLSLRKHAHAVCSDFYSCKMTIFSYFFYIFFIFAQNIDCGYTLEPPH